MAVSLSQKRVLSEELTQSHALKNTPRECKNEIDTAFSNQTNKEERPHSFITLQEELELFLLFNPLNAPLRFVGETKPGSAVSGIPLLPRQE